MPISVLSQDTIDKIAAGEVVERPASIVKELVENSIDAGAGAVTVEIRDGGISLIRVTDNGTGIPADEVRTAFLRHATSKIRTIDDLEHAQTLGFRGEALSSIAAVSQTELITKTPGALMGTRYQIEGGLEVSLEEVGAPEGTTLLIRNLFYNTPARRKFLKSAQAEAGNIGDLMERLALSHPEVSFKFMNQGQIRMHTSGNGRLKDIVYHIYGKDTAAHLLEVSADCGSFTMEGLIGKPTVSRGNRAHENYFVNGRYVKSNLISRAIEEAYKPFLMNHRYPFTILSIKIDGTRMDANVHPAKLEVRFSDPIGVYEEISRVVRDTLAGKELIPEISFRTDKEAKEEKKQREAEISAQKVPEPFEKMRREQLGRMVMDRSVPYASGKGADAFRNDAQPPEQKKMTVEPVGEKDRLQTAEQPAAGIKEQVHAEQDRKTAPFLKAVTGNVVDGVTVRQTQDKEAAEDPAAEVRKAEPVQMQLFDDRLLSAESRKRHHLIGQLFETFWLVEFDDKLYIIDQHAAHEKVLYERFMKQFSEKTQTSQQLSPPMILSLSMAEEETLQNCMEEFTGLGYEIEPFGGREYAISAVPGNLYDLSMKDLFIEMLDLLSQQPQAARDAVKDKVATMACKAAVKGNNRLSAQEADALIGELLTLENPYNCPHGRPTIVSMSHVELDRKFKRIL